jgi:hypothetical protein
MTHPVRHESPLVDRLRSLPMPAPDRERAVREFVRAERFADEAVELARDIRGLAMSLVNWLGRTGSHSTRPGV